MKALFAGLTLMFSLVGQSLAECTIDGSVSPAMAKVLKQHGFKGVDYDRICNTLKKANAGLYINGGSVAAPSGVIAAWASVSVIDSKTKLMNTVGLASTHLSTDSNRDPDLLLHEVTMDALRDMDLAVGIRQLKEMRRTDVRWSK